MEMGCQRQVFTGDVTEVRASGLSLERWEDKGGRGESPCPGTQWADTAGQQQVPARAAPWPLPGV